MIPRPRLLRDAALALSGSVPVGVNSDLKYADNCCNDLYTMNANGTGLTGIVADQPGVFLSDWGAAP
jgi:hypothetical protein